MQLSNAISDALVAVTSIVVFFRFFVRIPANNKILWGVFFVTLAMGATAGMCKFLGMTEITPVHQSLVRLAGSAGIVALLSGVWTLVNQQTASRMFLICTVVVGLTLFFTLSYPQFQPFEPVIQSLGMLVGMCFGVWGLMKKYQKSIWIIGGIMVIGLATKLFGQYLPFDSVTVYHVALMAMVISFGKAV
jgi:hypothetical protein